MGWDKLPVAIGQHLLFTLVSVAIGFALGLVLGILLSRRPKLSGVVLPVAIQSLIRVELPLAMPTIIGGLRMSTVYTVSWAVLASMIGGGGLGDFIYSGISSNDNGLILMGAIPAALLAFVLGSLVDLVQRQVVPKGMRKGGDKV